MPRISDWLVMQRPEERGVAIRSQVPLKDLENKITESRDKLEAYLRHIGIRPAGNFFVTYHSFSKKAVDLEAGFLTASKAAGREEIMPVTKRAGLYLTCIHQGARQTIPAVYREMDAWLQDQHFSTTGESEEIYLNENVQDALLVTQILIPILEDVNGE